MRDAGHLDHRPFHVQLRFGALERPRVVHNVGVIDPPASVRRVEAVALDEELLERSLRRRHDVPVRAANASA